jgi:peptide/nickel transport system permease protein
MRMAVQSAPWRHERVLSRIGRAVRLALPGRLFRHVCTWTLLLYIAMALFGPWLAPYSATTFDMANVLKAPTWLHPFGTDVYGRDVFSRVVVGAQSILSLSLVATAFGVSIGCAVGMCAGYLGGFIDELIMRVMDVMLALPGLLLALLIMTSLGSSTVNLVLSISIVFIPKSARVARGAILPFRSLGFVDAARMRGSGWASIVFRELMPNIRGELLVEFCLRFAYALLLISSLGFLGFGVQPPTPDWGLMISESRNFITVAPWTVLFPALSIGLAVVAVSSMADLLSAGGATDARRGL